MEMKCTDTETIVEMKQNVNYLLAAIVEAVALLVRSTALKGVGGQLASYT